MAGAPYRWCCKDECGTRPECKDCDSPVRGEKCPNTDIYLEEYNGCSKN